VVDFFAAWGFFEASDHVGDGVDFADVGEEFVSHAFALRGAGDEAGDVDEAECGGDDLFGGDELVDGVEARVWDLDDADVWLDGGEGIVCGEGAGGGECVEECGLADVGQADDAGFHGHGGGP